MDLKSKGASAPCGFDSRPAHHKVYVVAAYGSGAWVSFQNMIQFRLGAGMWRGAAGVRFCEGQNQDSPDCGAQGMA